MHPWMDLMTSFKKKTLLIGSPTVDISRAHSFGRFTTKDGYNEIIHQGVTILFDLPSMEMFWYRVAAKRGPS